MLCRLGNLVPSIRLGHGGIRLGLLCQIVRITAQGVSSQLGLFLYELISSGLLDMTRTLTRSSLWIWSVRPSRAQMALLSAL